MAKLVKTSKKTTTKLVIPAIYKGHREGSNKGAVHFMFDEAGVDEAMKTAAARGIKESTAKQWISSWNREAKKAVESDEAGTLAKDLKDVDDD